jgi:hypothetical protein
MGLVIRAGASSGGGIDGLFDITDFGAVADVVFLDDGVITASDATVTSATGGFTGQAGKTIVIGDGQSQSGAGTFTVTVASPAVFTKVGHGFTFGQAVILTTTGALPTGLTALTRYYVRDDAADTFRVSAAKGGTAINTSGTQSGTHTVTPTQALTTTIASVNSDTSVEVAFAPNVTGTDRKIQFGTDSTTAINDAIDACEAAGGGWVYVPPIGIFQAMDINLAHRGGIKFGGLIWGINQSANPALGVANGSVLVPTTSGNLLDCVGSVQLRIEDIQLGDTRMAARGTVAILIANSTTRTGDSYEIRNVTTFGSWLATPLYDFGPPIDIEHCRFWNYAGNNSAWGAILTRDNIFSVSSTHQTIATATTANPNCSIHDTEFHNFTGAETKNGAVRLRGALGVTFKTCLIDSADTVEGNIMCETADSVGCTFSLEDCTLYSESTGPIANAFSINSTAVTVVYEVGENTYVFGTAKTGGAGTVTFNSGIVPAAKVIGTAGNTTPAAGYIGQIISGSVATGSAVSLTSGANANITSISLTAGIWNLSALQVFTGAATTEVKYIIGCISIVSATLDSTPGRRNDLFYSSTPSVAIFANGNTPANAVGPVRLELAATTTVYLVALAEFDTSTMGAAGILSATRVG